ISLLPSPPAAAILLGVLGAPPSLLRLGELYALLLAGITHSLTIAAVPGPKFIFYLEVHSDNGPLSEVSESDHGQPLPRIQIAALHRPHAPQFLQRYSTEPKRTRVQSCRG
ncbi:Os04g0676800, partial [Oryza sativa Japonica Group]